MPDEKGQLEVWLEEGLEEIGVAADDAARERLLWIGRELLDWNRRMNLTAIRDEREMVEKHLVDSAAGLLALGPEEEPLCDLGTGPGFPGLALKVLRPGLPLLLVDAVGKKLQFARYVVERLGLADVEILHRRAEELGRDPAYRGRFRFVTARALAALPVLLEYAIPLLQVGGELVAYKGPGLESEIGEAGRAMEILGVRLERLVPVRLPGGAGERSLAVLKKVRETDPRYPRRPGLPAKRPL